MASGCIPQKADRLAAFKNAKEKLAEAVKLLDIVDNPDNDAASDRLIEDATTLIQEALGQREGAFVDSESPLGLTDLIEHYFS